MTLPSISPTARHLTKILRGYQRSPDPNLFQNLTVRLEKSKFLVQAFYAIIFFFSANTFIFSWDGWQKLDQLPDPVWALKWTVWLSWPVALALIGVGSTLITGATTIWPRFRWLRSLSFVFFFLLIAITNSFGKINHSFHVWVVSGFLLIFLPDNHHRSISYRQSYLTVIWGVQLLTLSFYTSSGLWKVAVGLKQMIMGELHSFHPLALSQQVANRLVITNSDSLLGAFVIEHPYLGWPLYLASIFLELFSFVVPFRPNLHRFWGISLILFHFGIWMTMGIIFHANMLFALLFFALSPFHPDNLSVKDVIYSLPIIGGLLATVIKQKPNPHQPYATQR